MSLHISKHQLQHIDFSEVLYLLASAVLGASLVFLLEESIWDFRTASFKAEIIEQDALLQKYEDELLVNGKQIVKLTKSENDLKNERNALASQLEEVRIESEQLKSQLQAKSDELTATHNGMKNLSEQNAGLVKDAKLLSQCVMAGKNLEGETYDLPEKIIDKFEGIHLGFPAELRDELIALETFNNSWSNGACSNATSVAERYPLN